MKMSAWHLLDGRQVQVGVAVVRQPRPGPAKGNGAGHSISLKNTSANLST
jgi:hypothetical protein